MNPIICRIVPLLFFLPISCEKIIIHINNQETTIYIGEHEGYDIPENDGVRNVLLNAAQITDCEYVTTNKLNALRTYEAGTSLTGIIYSSSRFEDLMCPNNVSLWTYMTSMSDPASYLYSVDLSEPPYSLRGLAKTIYGQSCSSFVRYALGIQYSFQIHQMTVWEDFEAVTPNEVNSLALGDMLTSEKEVHTRLVTGIKRKNHQVEAVILSEGTVPVALRKEWSGQMVQHSMDSCGYQIYRFRDIASVKHPPFPHDRVVIDENLINKHIMPKRGDCSNWRKDENIIIDILDGDSFDSFRIYKDGELYEERTFPLGANEIDLGVLPAGDYGLFLVNNNLETDPVYWMVVDYSVCVTSIGDSKVRVDFSSSNAKPIWLTWRRPLSYAISNNGMPLWTTVIDNDAYNKGYVESKMDDYLIMKYGLGDWDFKVAFQTKYGIISSDNISVFVH